MSIEGRIRRIGLLMAFSIFVFASGPVLAAGAPTAAADTETAASTGNSSSGLEEKVLGVPLMFQPDNSNYCGLTATRMVLSYYHITRTEEELKARMRGFDNINNSFNPDIGLLFLDEGFNVTLVTNNALLFPPKLIDKMKDKEGFSKYTDALQANSKVPLYKKYMLVLRQFVGRGGKVALEKPSFAHIKNAIDNGNPVIVHYWGQVLGPFEGFNHIVVIDGYRNGELHVRNPLSESRQGWYKTDLVIKAIEDIAKTGAARGAIIIPDRDPPQIAP